MVAHTSINVTGFFHWPEGNKIQGLEIADKTAIGTNDKNLRVTGLSLRLENSNKLKALMGNVAIVITVITVITMITVMTVMITMIAVMITMITITITMMITVITMNNLS